MLKQIHDELDAAVFDAYGWPHDLSDEEILERLVALNHERAEEEKRGLIRWLRPAFQNPAGGNSFAENELALENDSDDEESEESGSVTDWPERKKKGKGGSVKDRPQQQRKGGRSKTGPNSRARSKTGPNGRPARTAELGHRPTFQIQRNGFKVPPDTWERTGLCLPILMPNCESTTPPGT